MQQPPQCDALLLQSLIHDPGGQALSSTISGLAMYVTAKRKDRREAKKNGNMSCQVVGEHCAIVFGSHCTRILMIHTSFQKGHLQYSLSSDMLPRCNTRLHLVMVGIQSRKLLRIQLHCITPPEKGTTRSVNQ